MPTPIEQVQRDVNLQDYWVRRSLAALIDIVLILAPIYILSWLFLIGGGGFWYVGGLLSGFAWFVYSALLETAAGTTIGKSLFEMKVVAVSGRVDTGKTLIRNMTKIFALLFVLDLFLGMVVEGGDPRQRYSERVAGTLVIFNNKG
jgi:uncharacterized RDD family membrane protein YckC